jgi:hypothetical protein
VITTSIILDRETHLRAPVRSAVFVVITVADGMERVLLVMVRDELTGPLHEPYGALTIDTMTA